MVIVALIAPANPPDIPFQFEACRRDGALFWEKGKSSTFFSYGDEIFDSGWLLVDVRPRQANGSSHSVAIVVRGSDGRMAELWFDRVPDWTHFRTKRAAKSV